VKLPNNYFSARANRGNSSESASPAEMDMAHKTLYLLEELDNVAIHTSKLKEVVSMDDGRARPLYGENQNIKRIGHLMINGNTAPNLGTDPAVWDRAIYIPWDAKYVGADVASIDPANGIFRQDTKKKDELVKLTSAFLTVCLRDLTNYLKANPEASFFNTPACVKDLLALEKQKIDPIPVFLDNCLTPNPGYNGLTVQMMLIAFHGWCRQKYIRNTMDLNAFTDRVTRTKYEVVTQGTTESYVKGVGFTNDASAIYLGELNSRNFISADNLDIPTLFKRQRLN